MKIRVLIVEDDAIESYKLKSALTKMGYEVVGDSNAIDATLEIINEKEVDIALLDIDLNGDHQSGIILGDMMNNHQIPFIYVTGTYEGEIYDEAKKRNPRGYLLKPYQINQLQVVMDMVVDELKKSRESEAESKGNAQELLLKDKGVYKKVKINDILWFKADENYQLIITDPQNKFPLQTRQSINKLSEELSGQGFIRIHRKYLVNQKFIDLSRGFNDEELLVAGHQLPIGRTYKKQVMQLLGFGS